jgi:hypothetical protein
MVKSSSSAKMVAEMRKSVRRLKKMVKKVMKNRFTTAVELFYNEKLKHNDVSVRTIHRILINEDLNANRP